jgi:GDP-L-fucose synthase
MADACVHIMQKGDFKDLILEDALDRKEVRNTHINIGTGVDISIKYLAKLIKKIVGFKGDFVFNSDKPDGTMRKITDVSKLHGLGWKHSVELEEGVQLMYDWYLNKD